MRVNQRELASRLNLSVATVSKSLRNNSEIPPTTRAEVIGLASKLGYRSAQSRLDKAVKRKREVRTICLLLQSDSKVGSRETPHANLMLAGLTEAAHAANVSLVVHYVPLRDRDRVHEPPYQPVALREGILSGMIVMHYFPADVVQHLMTLVPCVSVVRHWRSEQLDHVDLDCGHAMGQIVNHLYALGHRRIGFLGSPSPLPTPPAIEQTWHQERFGAYVASLLSLGLDYDHAIADPARHVAVSEVEAVDRVVRQTREGVTAWVTASDHLGYLWYRQLTARGLRVPEDVSITGIDALGDRDGLPALTSIRIPLDAMGRASMGLLIRRIDEPAAPIQRQGFQGVLIEGATTAPARVS